MKTALLEIGLEHLPARFLLPTLKQLEENAAAILQKHNLKYVSLRAFGTYRKLALEIKELASKAEDIQKEVKGPPAKMLKDDKGAFTPQASGFAQKNGVAAKDLLIQETDKGPFIYANVIIKGESALKLLPSIFTELIKSLNFPKNMTWEDGGLRFARPIRSLLALYGEKIVPFTVCEVKSGRATHGLLSFGNKPIAVKEPAAYIAALKNNVQPILAETQERREALLKSLRACARALGYKADEDEALIEETVCFTEYPVALSGDFSAKFLSLPKELIATVLKKQLKMFPVADEKGVLQPHFIAVRDGVSDNQNEVRVGFKNVLTARLSDAVFFFEQDLKTGLEAMRQKLKTINFIDGAGTIFDKTLRVQKISAEIARKLDLSEEQKKNIETASLYAYADLASAVVYEFPELQGYMGGVYALRGGQKPQVAKAVEEFYLPLSASSSLPQSVEGCVISLAGKLDTLTANFALGQIPSGSEDPFALRRQAVGALRIISESGWDVKPSTLLSFAWELLPKKDENNYQALRDFFWQRMEGLLQEQGSQSDEILAVEIHKNRSCGEIFAAARALGAARKSELMASLGEAAKRVGNILKKSAAAEGKIRPELFQTKQEKALFDTVVKTEAEISSKLDYNITEKNCAEVFKALLALSSPLESFFESVMVNDKDETLRSNRIILLQRVNLLLTAKVADLSKLQKGGKL